VKVNGRSGGALVPAPRILERLDLRRGLRAVTLGE
jgi:hypothetical protein